MSWETKITQKDAVKSFFVMDGGKVNLEASVERYRSAALRHIAKQESDDHLISVCMTKLFDQFKGANLNLDFIKSQTVQLMGQEVPSLKDPSLFILLSARVEEMLHDNTNQPEVAAKGDKPGKPAIDGRIYGMRKGANGGFYRISDRSATTE